MIWFVGIGIQKENKFERKDDAVIWDDLGEQHEPSISRNMLVHTGLPVPVQSIVDRENFPALHPGPSHLHILSPDPSIGGHLGEILWGSIILRKQFLVFLSAFSIKPTLLWK